MDRKLFLCVIGFVLSCVIHAQDTIHVYFALGSANVSLSNQRLLNSELQEIDFDLYDSVLFIGVSDTTGSFELNKKISHKRAKSVLLYCSQQIPHGIKLKMRAKGEENSAFANKYSRRVDIVFYYAKTKTKLSFKVRRSECYEIDYELIQHAFIEEYTSRNRPTYYTDNGKPEKLVRIIVEKDDFNPRGTYYYSGEDKEGNFVYDSIRWVWGITGSGDAVRNRWYAIIPYQSYESHRIFTKTKSPCVACTDTLEVQQKPDNEINTIQQDYFLIKNIKYSVNRNWRFGGTVTVQVPRQFVQKNIKYYYGCDNPKQITWRYKRNSAFVTVPIIDTCLQSISKETICCKKEEFPLTCSEIFIEPEWYDAFTSGAGHYEIISDVTYRKNDLSGYSGIATSVLFPKSYWALAFGSSYDKKSNFLIRINYILTQKLLSEKYFFNTYIGTDNYFKIWKNKNMINTCSAGVEFRSYWESNFLNRVYLQYDYTYNMSKIQMLRSGIKFGVTLTVF